MGAALFFTALVTAGFVACFPLGLVAPLLNGFRLLQARASWRSRGPSVCELAREQPLPPHLSAAHRSFASDTRTLLADLEHAHAHAYRFSDAPNGGWWQQLIASQSGSAYASAIGITGEVWRWLRLAENLCDDVTEPAGPELDPLTNAVRALLFDARPLSELLGPLAALVGRVDTGLRTQASAPYRGKLPQPRLPATESPDEARSHADQARLRRYEDALAECKPAIRAIVRRFADPSDQADLAQEIRLAVWKALPAYRGDSSLRSYVLRIAKYRAITFRERRAVLESVRVWRDDTAEPDELLEQVRQRRALATAIKTLPGKLRLALEMRLAGSTYREIAEQLAISEKNASVRVSRARQALKRSLCPES